MLFKYVVELREDLLSHLGSVNGPQTSLCERFVVVFEVKGKGKGGLVLGGSSQVV